MTAQSGRTSDQHHGASTDIAVSRGVLFDLDETLIDRAASISDYANRFYSEFEPSIGGARETFLQRFLELDANGYVSRPTFFDHLEQYLAAPRLDRETISEHFAAHAWSQPIIMSGAVEGLQRLRTAGVATGIVSNGGSINQRRKINNTGLATLVDQITISEEFGVKKPDPSIFRDTCRQLQIDPGESWFVGDNPVLDITGAKGIGLQTIWLQRATPWPGELALCYTRTATSLEEAFDALFSEL